MPTSSVRQLKLRFLTLLLSLFAFTCPATLAQTEAQSQPKDQTPKQQVFCDPARALALVEAQLSEAKMFADPVKRIAVMTRAADLFWPYEQWKAHDTFADAFDLASEYFRERGDEERRTQGRADSPSSVVITELPDQRFVVLSAIARHDLKWARELAERAAKETREEAEKNRTSDARLRPFAEKLLAFAETLLDTDKQGAIAVARSTFSRPATTMLPDFLYKLAKVDRGVADALYSEALAAYAGRDIDSLLLLSAYPFGRNKGIAWSYWLVDVPEGFSPNADLQQQFAVALLRFSEDRLSTLMRQSSDAQPGGPSEPEKIYVALHALESLYPQPAALARMAALEGQAMTLVPADRQSGLASANNHTITFSTMKPLGEGDFNATIEKADDIPVGDRRDQLIMNAILATSDSVPAEKIEAAAQKIGDDETRRDVLNWFYFGRARDAAGSGSLDDARKLAEHVEALDERAMLFLYIAEFSLKRAGDRARASDLLEAVVAAAQRAPETEAKARALIGVAHLYARLDYLRGIEVLREAVKTVNKLKDPDLASTEHERKIQAKNVTHYMDQNTPGFSLENAARELGARDFEQTVSAASGLDDKYLRATAILSVAEECLEDSRKTDKPKSGKPKPVKTTPTADARKVVR
jgi:hypothetical protein